MSYLTQMAGLAVQNFVSAAVGIAVLAAVVRGHRAALVGHARQLLGRPLPLARLRAAAARRSSSRAPDLAGRAADLPRPRDRDARSRAHADDRARPGRVADRDQAARDERRRLLQLELGRPVREPDRALELHRDARDPADPGGPGVHVREDGARATACVGGVRGDVRRLRDRRRASTSPPEQHGSRGAAQLGREHHAGAAGRAAATCPTRRSASASPPRRPGRSRRATPRTARSTAASTRRRRAAAPCPLVNLFLGEVIFGGVGSGLYGMFFYIVIAVFVAGLMVGRTPEWLGKKIEAREIKYAAVGALFVPDDGARHRRRVAIVTTDAGLASIFNQRRPRLHRDALRLRLAVEQQRQRVRRLRR